MKVTRRQLRNLIYERVSLMVEGAASANVAGYNVTYDGNTITIDDQYAYELTLVGPSKHAGWQTKMIETGIYAAGEGEGSPVDINSIDGTTIKGSVGSLPGDIDLAGQLLDDLEDNIQRNSSSFVLHGPRVAIKFTQI